jgi:trans-aconitate methyltransferase
MLPTELIQACYRRLLGRAPENDAVVSDKARLASYDALLTNFLESAEFRRRIPPHFQMATLAPGRRVDVNVSQGDLDAMFARVRLEWSKLGEEDPFWSVLTEDSYRTEALDEDRKAAFFETGEESARAIEVFAERAGVTVPVGRCVEFGCGVGRVTGHLARRFEEVVAVDISPKNLEICERALQDAGHSNVRPMLLRSPSDVYDIPSHDFLFSTIVFQHNPPPVQHFLLDVLLSKLQPGGGFLVQIPTHTPNYEFATDAYLASVMSDMEMHDLPMSDVLKLVAKHGAMALEVVMDGWTGLYGSHTFFGVKPA